MATKDISVIRDKKTGDIKDIRDKKLADGTEQTTLSQSGTVQGWDANGNAIFIPRDSVLQILSEVINSNNQSTIGSLFGMGANNTPASINMANLASVLSAVKYSHQTDPTWGDFYTLTSPDGAFQLIAQTAAKQLHVIFGGGNRYTFQAP